MVQKALEKYKELRPSQTMKNQAGEHVILVMRAGSDEIVDCGGEGLYLLLLSHPPPPSPSLYLSQADISNPQLGSNI